jgi:hypothetical protein
MFQAEQDVASRAENITYRHRPARNDYTTDTRADWCIARLHNLPNRFDAAQYDSIGRHVTEAGLGLCSV